MLAAHCGRRHGWASGRLVWWETKQTRPEAGQTSLSGCGPAGPAEENRLELIRHARASGATAEEIEAAENIGELVLDLNLRPRLEFTLREVIDGAGIDWSRAQRLPRGHRNPVVRR